MLRLIFTESDLSRVRVAPKPDPLWEITNSLDRLQTRRGRWAYAPWHRSTLETLADPELRRTVRSMLLPLFPRAAYFPDFLTPPAALEGLEAGIEEILATPAERVRAELKVLGMVHHAPSWSPRLAAEPAFRAELGEALRTYYQRIIQPHDDTIQTALDGDRALRGRALLRDGVAGLFESYRPMLNWRPPVLEVKYPFRRTVHLAGRGLLLIPSYFCWEYPVALADADLPPVLIYPLIHEADSTPLDPGRPSAAALMGTTRAAVLRATATGQTAAEISRRVGIGAPTTSHHLKVLRDSGLIATHRHHNTDLHVLTPLGATLLRGKPAR